MAAKKEDTTATENNTLEVLWVSSIAPRFCRCGLLFSPEPIAIPLTDLTEEALDRLENEPNLRCKRGLLNNAQAD